MVLENLQPTNLVLWRSFGSQYSDDIASFNCNTFESR